MLDVDERFGAHWTVAEARYGTCLEHQRIFLPSNPFSAAFKLFVNTLLVVDPH